MNVEIIPSIWGDADLDVEFELPHYDQRVAVYVDTNKGDRIANETLIDNRRNGIDLSFGDNWI